MKKKFYTVFLFAMMGLMPAQAQVVRTEQMRTVNAAEIEGQTVKKMLPVWPSSILMEVKLIRKER